MMTKFFYIARDYQQGNLIKGSLVANNKLEVIDYLRREQYLIIAIHNNDIYSIKEYIKSIGKDEKITNKQVILLCQQLSIILESGIDIIEALKIVKNNLRDKNIKNFIEKTIIGLNEGENLSAIWQKNFNLPAYLISSINIAEHTGLLAEALKDTGIFLAKEYELKQKLRQICIYPVFLLCVLAIVIMLMIFLVIPAFADIFQRMHIDLPYLTATILSIGLNIKAHFIKLCTFLLIIFIAIILVGQKDKLRLIFLQYILKLPVFGDFLRKFYLVNIVNQLIFLLGSGISIDEALNIMLNSNHNILVQDNLKTVQNLVKQGFSLADAFAKVSLSVNILQEFIDIGEKTGMLKDILSYLVSFWEKELDNTIKICLQLLEPILMISVGFIVGVFIIAIIMPLFDLVNNIGL
ncbi:MULTISPECIES: type II secretion system F family protein [Megamonas]|uniref:type II secretion system F family protein n=3 Tax=Selenomonadaceae TaxID=1843491 RepID=UPI00142F83D1|nr:MULTISPECIES: type II secretion system F family protein [Megamonas]MBM6747738.1 type II secretion system F family protein [Megamonas rupellensis]NJE28166.1 type II secretion system F family protein [Megamonas funiformis]